MSIIRKVFTILLGVTLMFMNISGVKAQDDNTTTDFSNYITAASLDYKEGDKEIAYATDTKLTKDTPLVFKLDADVPSSALSSDHKIDYQLPDNLNVDDTTSDHIYLKDDLTKSVGNYTIADHHMVIDLSALDYGVDSSKSIELDLETTTSHLIFTDSEAKIYFRKATNESPTEVMVSVLQNYANDTKADPNSIIKNTNTDTNTKKSSKQVITMSGVERADSSVKARADAALSDVPISGDIATDTKNYLQWGSDHSFYLSGDASINNGVVVTRNITLDLNGHTLTVNNTNGIKVNNGASLTIKDSSKNESSKNESSKNESSKNESYKEETTTVSGNKYGHEAEYDASSKTITYYVTNSEVAEKDSRLTTDTLVKHTVSLNSAVGTGVIRGNLDNGIIHVSSGGLLELDGGTLENSGTNSTSFVNVIDLTEGNSRFTMNGGALHPTGSKSNRRAIYCAQDATFTMKNGYIYGGVADQGGAIYNNGGTLELSGGVIAANHTNYNDDKDKWKDKHNWDSYWKDHYWDNYWEYGRTYCGGGIYNNSGTINISGQAVISGNYVGNKDYNINDYGKDLSWPKEKVQGYGMGGGIYAYQGNVNINGGYITNNIKYGSENGQGWNDYGGGGIACYEATITMDNGYITGNKSEETGGGISLGLYDSMDTKNNKINVHHSTFNMNGGYLSSNYAETGEGGGMRIACNSTANVKGSQDSKIYVTNNKTNTNFDWGGGGIFIQGENENPDMCGTLNIQNVTIAENKAGGYGAGVSVCPTGQTIIASTNGGAIYNNSANNPSAKSSRRTNTSSNPDVSGGGAGKNMDSTIAKPVFKEAVTGDNASKNIFGTHQVPDDLFLSRSKWKDRSGNENSDIIALVMGSMLGGGDANWRGVYDSNISQKGLDDNGHPSNDVEVKDVNATTVSSTGHIAAKYLIGLTADGVSPADQKKATDDSNVFVTGNESGIHGGGIMTNGALKIGEARSQAITPSFNIEGVKKYLIDQTDYYPTKDNNYTKFKFDVYKDSVDAKKNNLISKDLFNDQKGQFKFNVTDFVKLTENNGGYKLDQTKYTYWITEDIPSQEDGIQYDSSRYKVEVTVGETASEVIELMGVSFKSFGITNVKVTRYKSDGKTEIANYSTYKKNSDGTYTIELKNTENASQAFTNSKITQFKIKKIDKDSKAALSGAEFSLYQHDDSKNTLVQKGSETDAKGEITFKNVARGKTYYLVETKSPANYLKAESPWVIKVGSDTKTVTLYKSNEKITDQTDLATLKLDENKLTQPSVFTTSDSSDSMKIAEFDIGNTRAYTMPNTGGMGTYIYYQVGFLLLTLVNIVWIIKRRVA
ncbi:MAG: SpaA isopeptide-forming pilin-related protein [Intestinibaculum porci]|uniref:SpaA isopeptide-forming pilin-related protein n=1 Tax=Intestinibaculum porci TaxID=2487118 RepID=UPI003EFF9B8C